MWVGLGLHLTLLHSGWLKLNRVRVKEELLPGGTNPSVRVALIWESMESKVLAEYSLPFKRGWEG